ncbi:MAG: DUF4342 domain-containing protein [Oscillospiraceae bacterium]|nr:DUF4342 domain-containing protein [Oscillospiraceae bacterium]
MQDENARSRADEVVDRLKELVRKGNVARILVRRGEDLILNIPLNVGIAGTILGITAAPWALIASAVATLGFDAKIELEKTDGEIVELFSREVGERAAQMGSDAVEGAVEDLKDLFHGKK